MNTIFVKEVTSSVMKKNIVKLDLNHVGNDTHIIELNINSKKLAAISSIISDKEVTCVINKSNGIIYKLNELRKKIVQIKFNNEIKKIITKNELNGYSVIFSNELRKKNVKKYIEELLNNFSINEYLCLNSIEQNYLKYINEYILNNNIKKEKIDIVLIAESADSINLDIVETLNSEYKDINIFCLDKIGRGFQNKIKNINDDVGSCIQILNKNNKDFRKHNVCIFIDKPRTTYSNYKFNKKSCYIDFTNKENDKFNKKYLKLQDGIKKNKYYGNKIRELYELYGKITVSNAIID